MHIGLFHAKRTSTVYKTCEIGKAARYVCLQYVTISIRNMLRHSVLEVILVIVGYIFFLLIKDMGTCWNHNIGKKFFKVLFIPAAIMLFQTLSISLKNRRISLKKYETKKTSKIFKLHLNIHGSK